MAVRKLTWVVKASKLCNLRCSYCYEWDQLADKTRVGDETWRGLFRMIGEHHLRGRRLGEEVSSLVVLHGGEPLVQPLSYWSRMLSICKDELGGLAESTRFKIAMQSNMYSLKPEQINFLVESGISLSVSFDGIGGVRKSLTGLETESRVLRNIDRARESGLAVGGVAVLAGHTCERICDVYDQYARRDMSLRVLPLFDGPDTRPMEAVRVTHEQITSALSRLFVHWVKTGYRVPVEPLVAYLQTAVYAMAGVNRTPYSRRQHGDGVLVMETNGDLYRVLDLGEATNKMGNVCKQSFDELLVSDEYAASLDRDDEAYKRHCESCSLKSSCPGTFIHQSAAVQSIPYTGSCPVAHDVQVKLIEHLQSVGFTADELRQTLASQLASRTETEMVTV